jgi:hypothetical protein
MAETPRFNSAQSPRLGQRLPNETSSVRIFNGEEIPPEAWRGMSIFREDTQELLIFTDPGWVAVVGGQRNQKTFIQDAQPDTEDDFVNVGDHWLETDVTPKVWRIFNEEGVWEPLIPTLDELGPVSGKVLQTSLDANRGVKITSAGITGYDSTVGSPTLGDAKFILDAATGTLSIIDGEFSGSVTAGGASLDGGQLSFSSTGSTISDAWLFGLILSANGASLFVGADGTNLIKTDDPVVVGSLHSDGAVQADTTLYVAGASDMYGNLDMNGNDINNVDVIDVTRINAGNIKNGNNTITGFGGADTNTKSITFASAFTGTPTVIVTLFGAAASPGQWSPPVVFNRSSTGFDVKVKRLAGTDTTVDFEWIATQA